MLRELQTMLDKFLGRVSLEDIPARPPTHEIRQATHDLTNAASKLCGAIEELKKESEALALSELERSMRRTLSRD